MHFYDKTGELYWLVVYVFLVTEVEFTCNDRDEEVPSNSYSAPLVNDDACVWSEEECRSAELQVLDKVEDLEERVFQASVYTKVSEPRNSNVPPPYSGVRIKVRYKDGHD